MQNRSIKLFLLRHCEDVGSQLGKFEDLKLTINGEGQAEKIALSFLEEGITSIYTSPMMRAKQTAQIISEKIGITPIESELLKDRDVGEFSGKTFKQIQKQYSQLLNQSTFTSDFKFPGGETNNDVFLRANQFIETFFNTSRGTNEVTLIVSHSLILNYLIYILQKLGFQPELLYLFEYGMGCIINKEYGQTVFRMIEFRNYYDKIEMKRANNNL
ncbi:MAG: histidine phosphatase family protein [Candidatus Kariarchaeaceae archaeon]